MTTPVPEPYVSSRRIGQATVTVINDGALRWNPHLQAPEDARRRAMPEAEPDGTLTLGCHVAHVRLGAASVLIDTGYDDPSPELARAHPNFTSSPGVTAGLASVGVRPEEITHVLITHAHGDHVAGGSVERDGRRVPRYPNARHIIGRRDWEGNPQRDNPASLLSLHLGPVAEAGLLDLVDDETTIVPGISMIPAPGESPGHCLVRIAGDGQTCYFLGDLFHHPCEAAHLDWVSQGRDPAAMRASRDALVSRALAEDALLITSHMLFPGFGRLRQEGDRLRWVEA